MMSATVAGDGAGCWAEASAMICSLGDPIALLGIGSHRRARGPCAWLRAEAESARQFAAKERGLSN
jgi:hypothetical protein